MEEHSPHTIGETCSIVNERLRGQNGESSGEEDSGSESTLQGYRVDSDLEESAGSSKSDRCVMCQLS